MNGVRLEDATRHTRVLACEIVMALMFLTAASARATTYYVGGSGCSDGAGVGTPSQPFCTISAALAAFHSPGTIIEVNAGTYREQITVPASGSSGSPLVVRAATGATVTVDGADDFSSTSQWAAYDAAVYRAATVTWAPLEVWMDNVALVQSTGDPHLLADNTWEYVAGEGLYLRAGGANPGTHDVKVGRRTYGVLISGRSYVTIQGLTIVHAQGRAIQANNSSRLELLGNDLSRSGEMGMQISNGSSCHLADNVSHDNGDHGIALIGGSTGCTIERNECYGNAVPGQRSANGIYLYQAPQNVLSANRLHDNQDTGLDLHFTSNGNLLLQNQSWHNGDHGFDHTHVTDNVHIGDVSFGNFNDGFSIEGNATRQTLYDCISVDNGITTNHSDLFVDDSSKVGFVSDDNVIWNSTSQSPIRWGNVRYSTVSAFTAASGLDTRTVQADPKFADGSGGNFHLLSGSPAIDNGNSSVTGYPPLDAETHGRADDPGTANTGLGPIAYADRGAYEFGGTTLAVEPGFWHSATAAMTTGPDLTVQPNPMRVAASLTFRLSQPGIVTASVYTVDGRPACPPVALELAVGEHTLPLPARDDRRPLAGGIYFCELKAPEGRAVRRLVVLP
jgi:parallel beta-helix repeat protein